jgi:hypothetical protein
MATRSQAHLMLAAFSSVDASNNLVFASFQVTVTMIWSFILMHLLGLINVCVVCFRFIGDRHVAGYFHSVFHAHYSILK